MRRIFATGHADEIQEDRPVLYVSAGAGNLPGEPEVHIHAEDPLTGESVRFWVPRDEVLAALLHPEGDPAPQAIEEDAR